MQMGFFCKVEFKNFVLSADKYNKWFLTKDNTVVAMKYVSLENGAAYIFGNPVESLSNVFETPINSSFLNIYKAINFNTCILNLYTISKIKCKLVYVEFNNEMFFFPLLHTLDYV